MKVGQKVKTSLGMGEFLGYECFDVEERKEINWRIELIESNCHTTGRKAVKMENEFPHLTDNIAYFFEHEDIKAIEFKKGDIVTFKAYEEEIKAKVSEVLEDGHLFSGEPHYKLTGVSAPLLSYATGKSIKESIYFDNKPFSFAD